MRAFLSSLAALALTLAFVAGPPAHAQGISQKVATCDPSYPNRCIKPGADGSVPISGTISVGSVTTKPFAVTPTNKSGTIASGGTAQTAIAANASRQGWCIQNLDATEVMYVRSGAAATTGTGTKLGPGAQACNAPGLIDQGNISVIAATTAHAFSGFELQ